MTTLYLTDDKKGRNEFTIVRKRPMDRPPVVETKLRSAEPPRGVNIFSLARVICKRANGELPISKIAV